MPRTLWHFRNYIDMSKKINEVHAIMSRFFSKLLLKKSHYRNRCSGEDPLNRHMKSQVDCGRYKMFRTIGRDVYAILSKANCDYP